MTKDNALESRETNNCPSLVPLRAQCGGRGGGAEAEPLNKGAQVSRVRGQKTGEERDLLRVPWRTSRMLISTCV